MVGIADMDISTSSNNGGRDHHVVNKDDDNSNKDKNTDECNDEERPVTESTLHENDKQSKQPVHHQQQEVLSSSASTASNDTEITIKIVSAEYGPCEGLRLATGELSDNNSTSIPVTRDVAPFIRALLVAGRLREERKQQERHIQLQQKEGIFEVGGDHNATSRTTNNNSNINNTDESDDEDDDDEQQHTTNSNTSTIVHSDSVRVHPASSVTGNDGSKSYIRLFSGRESMNAAFGDPCPGISKRLYVHYIVTVASIHDDAKTRAAKTEVHHVSFAEHERVVLRRRLTFFQDDSRLRQAVVRSQQKQQQQRPTNSNNIHNSSSCVIAIPTTSLSKTAHGGDDDDEITLQRARHMGRSQSIAEFTAESMSLDSVQISQSTTLFTTRGNSKLSIQHEHSKTKTATTDNDSMLLSDIQELPNTKTTAAGFATASSVASSTEITDEGTTATTRSSSSSNNHGDTYHVTLHPSSSSSSQQQHNRQWRLRSAVSEIVLPIVLPYLDVWERVQCRLVCRSWKHVVRDWGVATQIDSNDPNITKFTIPFLRGILSHSYTSLHSLFLSGFDQLVKDDLHPSIPHLRKLRSLDVTGCLNLDDSTLQLLAQSVHPTLEVLYIKGLRRVTDVGMKAICQYCTKLEVLDISQIPITDEGGMAIQQLSKLKALFTRDNYKLTNKSIDIITAKCTRLSQLTLWGCIRLTHLTFGGNDASTITACSGAETATATTTTTTTTTTAAATTTTNAMTIVETPTTNSPLSTKSTVRPRGGGKNLVFLNLWGCHTLKDESAQLLGRVTKLRSLIVSECHRLTDRFVIDLANSLPQLNHLHLRYCKRITDEGVNAITNAMASLYSLDLSFCTRITATSIFNLLEIRYASLSELRLKDCKKLDIFQDPQDYARGNSRPSGGAAGRKIINAIRAHNIDNCLCLLDVRDCGPSSTEPYPDRDPFVQGMVEMRFQQRLPGFFCRRGGLNSTVQRRLVKQLVGDT